MVELFANSGDPDQMLYSTASDRGLHCLPVTLLWVSRLQWVKGLNTYGRFSAKEDSWLFAFLYTKYHVKRFLL